MRFVRSTSLKLQFSILPALRRLRPNELPRPVRIDRQEGVCSCVLYCVRVVVLYENAWTCRSRFCCRLFTRSFKTPTLERPEKDIDARHDAKVHVPRFQAISIEVMYQWHKRANYRAIKSSRHANSCAASPQHVRWCAVRTSDPKSFPTTQFHDVP